ncbi:DUF309 domain-containing protein [Actinoplanes subtropicus]|uniref:DUF309 domain-containing protein n=1 Tax=Actinoplanes subtropicus TaxID=543632 RepID=UPI001FDF56BC|nr:DUF309 domain-containing protein [Actinoplanes subtropicus]
MVGLCYGGAAITNAATGDPHDHKLLPRRHYGVMMSRTPAASDDDRVPRDRDAAGRARNARPRDGLGRPLPRGMVGVPTTPEDSVLSPAEALREAERLLAAGRPFHAHEVLEGAWKACGDDTRELWKGLAQLAVGVTHVRRGNRRGAVRLLTRAADRIEPYAAAGPYGVAAGALTAWSRALAARIELDDGGVAEEELAPRLLG